MTIGFPRMHKEPGERRVFLPGFLEAIAANDVVFLLEDEYGEELEIGASEYLRVGPVRFVSHREAYAADLVIVLRAPERHEFGLFRRGSVLLSMLHFPTRPWRVDHLSAAGVDAIAMDRITDDEGRRLVENLDAVAWNGLEAAFDLLEELLPGYRRGDGEPLFTTVLGTGRVGRIALDAATKFGRLSRNERLMMAGHPGAVALAVGRNTTGNTVAMKRILRRSDILADATQRRNPSVPVIPNDWIDDLPEHAVIADLNVDPYLPEDDPPVVRAIEGIPRGDLDHFRFRPDDPDWNGTIPPSVSSRCRRAVVSCYSWPGIHPRECMEHYGRQLAPLVRTLIAVGYDRLSAEGDYYSRALLRGSLRFFCER